MKKVWGLVLALVCVFSLAGCSPAPGEEEKWDLIPMVMVDGILYLDTGHTNTEQRKCGTPDGEIASQVDGSEKPAADGQSNFGTGYGYQYGAREGTIEIYMNEKWRIFATEEVRQAIQFPEWDVPAITNIVDRTETEGLPTDTAFEKFHEDGDREYYFSTIKSHYILVTYEDGGSEDIVTALEAGRASIADLDAFGIAYSVEEKDK